MSSPDPEKKLDSTAAIEGEEKTVAMDVNTGRPASDSDIDEEATVAIDSERGADAVALEEAERKASENWDKYLRAVAELENVRKRAARDTENAHKFAVERFAKDLLQVADSLAMGLDAADSTDADKLKEGTEATLKLLHQVFARFSVVELDPLGAPFDPEFHEAMTMQPSADAEPGSVLMVVQRGYTLNDRLLRPARVVVASEPA